MNAAARECGRVGRSVYLVRKRRLQKRSERPPSPRTAAGIARNKEKSIPRRGCKYPDWRHMHLACWPNG